jgi:cell shape-determining protein MreC
MIKLENQLKDYNFFMAERDKMESENDKLKKSLDDEK